MATCEHTGNTLHAPDTVLDGLPECQAKEGRHKCCICAYNYGKILTTISVDFGTSSSCKHNKSVPDVVWNAISEAQAGNARHKCAYTAYQEGVAAP